MKIDSQILEQIQAQVKRKDQAAFALGVAVSEYELAKAGLSLLAETVTRDGRLLRLGALQHEFDGYRDLHMKVVVQANVAQASLGEAALVMLGLPKEGHTFTIDEKTGDVLELISGAYVPVLEVT